MWVIQLFGWLIPTDNPRPRAKLTLPCQLRQVQTCFRRNLGDLGVGKRRVNFELNKAKIQIFGISWLKKLQICLIT